MIKISTGAQLRSGSSARRLAKTWICSQCLKRDIVGGLPRGLTRWHRSWLSKLRKRTNGVAEEVSNPLSRLRKNCNRLLSSPALHSYTKVRHKLIAHTELLDSEDGTVRRFDVQQEGLKFGNEGELVDQMISVLNDLLGLIDGSEFSWESDRKLHVADTCAFWGIESLE